VATREPTPAPGPTRAKPVPDRAGIGRGERVLPGVWRLRLPLPWPGVPHCNAWALRAGEGIVLVDTGYADDDGTRQLEHALAQVGLDLVDVRLLVCTHAHSDHYGLAGPIIDAAGCELWMHPAWEHVRGVAEDPGAALDRRIEVARQSGVPPAALERYRESRRGQGVGIARTVAPDRELVPGVAVVTDAGTWQVHETPGHAPSHIVLHEPERGLLLSGDHLLGRVSLFFDHGHTPDPVGEFLLSLARVEKLDATQCLAGHGRPFRDVRGKIRASRNEVDEHLGRVREAVSDGPRTVFEVVPELIGAENLNAATAAWGIQMTLAYLEHLVLAGELAEVDGSDPRRFVRA
jgi:glyoxylase-like metal-dependent hydrolase (beta-lactamase superfamily II)